MFQRESTALFHEHLKAYAIIGISATGERPSLAYQKHHVDNNT